MSTIHKPWISRNDTHAESCSGNACSLYLRQTSSRVKRITSIALSLALALSLCPIMPKQAEAQEYYPAKYNDADIFWLHPGEGRHIDWSDVGRPEVLQDLYPQFLKQQNGAYGIPAGEYSYPTGNMTYRYYLDFDKAINGYSPDGFCHSEHFFRVNDLFTGPILQWDRQNYTYDLTDPRYPGHVQGHWDGTTHTLTITSSDKGTLKSDIFVPEFRLPRISADVDESDLTGYITDLDRRWSHFYYVGHGHTTPMLRSFDYLGGARNRDFKRFPNILAFGGHVMNLADMVHDTIDFFKRFPAKVVIQDSIYLPEDSSELFSPFRWYELEEDPIFQREDFQKKFRWFWDKTVPNVPDYIQNVRSGWVTEDGRGMLREHLKFYNILKFAPIHGLQNCDTSRVVNMNKIFYGNKVTDLSQISNWNISRVEDLSHAFEGCEVTPAVANWNTSNVTSMSYTFAKSPTINPDVSTWKTDKVTDMSGMFAHAKSATPNTSQWNTTKVTNMSEMFALAVKANPDVSHWDVSHVTDMTRMFGNAVTYKHSPYYINAAHRERPSPEGDGSTFLEIERGAMRHVDPDMSAWTSIAEKRDNMFSSLDHVPTKMPSAIVSEQIGGKFDSFDHGDYLHDPDTMPKDYYVQHRDTSNYFVQHDEPTHIFIKQDLTNASYPEYVIRDFKLKSLTATLGSFNKGSLAIFQKGEWAVYTKEGMVANSERIIPVRNVSTNEFNEVFKELIDSGVPLDEYITIAPISNRFDSDKITVFEGDRLDRSTIANHIFEIEQVLEKPSLPDLIDLYDDNELHNLLESSGWKKFVKDQHVYTKESLLSYLEGKTNQELYETFEEGYIDRLLNEYPVSTEGSLENLLTYKYLNQLNKDALKQILLRDRKELIKLVSNNLDSETAHRWFEKHPTTDKERLVLSLKDADVLHLPLKPMDSDELIEGLIEKFHVDDSRLEPYINNDYLKSWVKAYMDASESNRVNLSFHAANNDKFKELIKKYPPNANVPSSRREDLFRQFAARLTDEELKSFIPRSRKNRVSLVYNLVDADTLRELAIAYPKYSTSGFSVSKLEELIKRLPQEEIKRLAKKYPYQQLNLRPLFEGDTTKQEKYIKTYINKKNALSWISSESVGPLVKKYPKIPVNKLNEWVYFNKLNFGQVDSRKLAHILKQVQLDAVNYSYIEINGEDLARLIRAYPKQDKSLFTGRISYSSEQIREFFNNNTLTTDKEVLARVLARNDYELTKAWFAAHPSTDKEKYRRYVSKQFMYERIGHDKIKQYLEGLDSYNHREFYRFNFEKRKFYNLDIMVQEHPEKFRLDLIRDRLSYRDCVGISSDQDIKKAFHSGGVYEAWNNGTGEASYDKRLMLLKKENLHKLANIGHKELLPDDLALHTDAPLLDVLKKCKYETLLTVVRRQKKFPNYKSLIGTVLSYEDLVAANNTEESIRSLLGKITERDDLKELVRRFPKQDKSTIANVMTKDELADYMTDEYIQGLNASSVVEVLKSKSLLGHLVDDAILATVPEDELFSYWVDPHGLYGLIDPITQDEIKTMSVPDLMRGIYADDMVDIIDSHKDTVGSYVDIFNIPELLKDYNLRHDPELSQEELTEMIRTGNSKIQSIKNEALFAGHWEILSDSFDWETCLDNYGYTKEDLIEEFDTAAIVDLGFIKKRAKPGQLSKEQLLTVGTSSYVPNKLVQDHLDLANFDNLAAFKKIPSQPILDVVRSLIVDDINTSVEDLISKIDLDRLDRNWKFLMLMDVNSISMMDLIPFIPPETFMRNYPFEKLSKEELLQVINPLESPSDTDSFENLLSHLDKSYIVRKLIDLTKITETQFLDLLDLSEMSANDKELLLKDAKYKSSAKDELCNNGTIAEYAPKMTRDQLLLLLEVDEEDRNLWPFSEAAFDKSASAEFMLTRYKNEALDRFKIGISTLLDLDAIDLADLIQAIDFRYQWDNVIHNWKLDWIDYGALPYDASYLQSELRKRNLDASTMESLIDWNKINIPLESLVEEVTRDSSRLSALHYSHLVDVPALIDGLIRGDEILPGTQVFLERYLYKAQPLISWQDVDKTTLEDAIDMTKSYSTEWLDYEKVPYEELLANLEDERLRTDNNFALGYLVDNSGSNVYEFFDNNGYDYRAEMVNVESIKGEDFRKLVNIASNEDLLTDWHVDWDKAEFSDDLIKSYIVKIDPSQRSRYLDAENLFPIVTTVLNRDWDAETYRISNEFAYYTAPFDEFYDALDKKKLVGFIRDVTDGTKKKELYANILDINAIQHDANIRKSIDYDLKPWVDLSKVTVDQLKQLIASYGDDRDVAPLIDYSSISSNELAEYAHTHGANFLQFHTMPEVFTHLRKAEIISLLGLSMDHPDMRRFLDSSLGLKDYAELIKHMRTPFEYYRHGIKSSRFYPPAYPSLYDDLFKYIDNSKLKKLSSERLHTDKIERLDLHDLREVGDGIDTSHPGLFKATGYARLHDDTLPAFPLRSAVDVPIEIIPKLKAEIHINDLNGFSRSDPNFYVEVGLANTPRTASLLTGTVHSESNPTAVVRSFEGVQTLQLKPGEFARIHSVRTSSEEAVAGALKPTETKDFVFTYTVHGTNSARIKEGLTASKITVAGASSDATGFFTPLPDGATGAHATTTSFSIPADAYVMRFDLNLEQDLVELTGIADLEDTPYAALLLASFALAGLGCGAGFVRRRRRRAA